MFVDPKDARGWRLVVGTGRGPQPGLIDLWCDLIAKLDPSVVIDVGVNYGEFLLPPAYPGTTRVIGVEANRHLAKWLDRSIAEHPDRAQIEVFYALASDQAAEGVDFWIDPDWSGRSTAAVATSASDRLVRDQASAITIDSLFELDRSPVGGVTFKVDTEGWEAHVLRGMTGLLDAATWSIGMIEFHADAIGQAGDDAKDVLVWLTERFVVTALDRSGKPIARVDPTDPWPSLRSMAPEIDGTVRVDLLLASDEQTIESAGVRTAAS